MSQYFSTAVSIRCRVLKNRNSATSCDLVETGRKGPQRMHSQSMPVAKAPLTYPLISLGAQSDGQKKVPITSRH